MSELNTSTKRGFRFWPILGIVLTIIATGLCLAFMYKATTATPAHVQAYRALASKGQKIEGRVVRIQQDLDMYGSGVQSKGGPGASYGRALHVVIEYPDRSGRKQMLTERWPLTFENKFQPGNSIPLYYLPENLLIPAASVLLIESQAAPNS